MPRVEDLVPPDDCPWGEREPSWIEEAYDSIDWNYVEAHQEYFGAHEEEEEPSDAWLKLYSFLYWK